MKQIGLVFTITVVFLVVVIKYYDFSSEEDVNKVDVLKEKIKTRVLKKKGDIQQKQKILHAIKDKVSTKSEEFKVEDNASIEKLYTLINNKDYSKLEQFHHANLLCSSTIGYDSQYDYTLDNPSLSIKEAEKIFADCSEVEIKGFNDLLKIYNDAITSGVKTGEFMLAITYPPLFEEHYQYLSQATSWQEDSLHLLNQSLAEMEGIGDDKKLFWAKVFQYLYPDEGSLLVDNIFNYEASLDLLLNESISSSALLWVNSRSEAEKRAIIAQLNENL
jgi:hypothetical protein